MSSAVVGTFQLSLLASLSREPKEAPVVLLVPMGHWVMSAVSL